MTTPEEDRARAPSETEWTNREARIRRGNFVYPLSFFQTGAPHVPIHVANGALGGCFDEFGLQSRPQYHMDNGRTHLGYVNHYARDPRNGGHDMASLCFLDGRHADGARPGLAGLAEYRQEFDLPTAVHKTAWRGRRGSFGVEAFASFAESGLFVWKLDQRPATADDRIDLTLDFETGRIDTNGGTRKGNPALGQRVVGGVALGGGVWKIRSETNCRRTEVVCAVLDGDAEFEEGSLRLRPGAGGCTVLLHVMDRERRAETAVLDWLLAADHKAAHLEAAREFWCRGALVDIPDPVAAQVWLRSRYYLRASLASFPTHVPEPTGLNANIWGHGFAQDMFYVVENLPRLGLAELAAAQFPIWLEMLPGVLRYTKRLTGCEGAFFPWTPPFENMDGFETVGPTNPDSYEFHNSAYVAAMVWHAWLIDGDRDFLRQYQPVVREVARFYSSLTAEGPEGRMRIIHPLIRCQDEHMTPGELAESPLCAMVSARAAIRYYLESCRVLGPDDEALERRCAEILQRDFDFAALLRPDGSLKTTLNDPRPPGLQKHPVQLNPIALLPQPDLLEAEPAFARAWRDRLRLTAQAEEPRSFGWTFALFALASARMGDGRALQDDLDLIQPARFADGLWFQFYESSCRLGWQHKKPYYFPATGLYLQALTDAVAQDWRGRIEFFRALPPGWLAGRTAFQGLRLRGGLTASGWRDARDFEVSCRATRDFSGWISVSEVPEWLEVVFEDGTTRREPSAGFALELARHQSAILRPASGGEIDLRATSAR